MPLESTLHLPLTRIGTIMDTKVTWSPAISMGIPSLDIEHAKIFKLSLEVEQLCQASVRMDSSRFHEILNELCVYARDHFSHEEKLMEASGYPELIDVRKKHNEFITALADITFNATRDVFETEKLNSLLSYWLVNHILDEDMKYRDFLDQKKQRVIFTMPDA